MFSSRSSVFLIRHKFPALRIFRLAMKFMFAQTVEWEMTVVTVDLLSGLHLSRADGRHANLVLLTRLVQESWPV